MSTFEQEQAATNAQDSVETCLLNKNTTSTYLSTLGPLLKVDSMPSSSNNNNMFDDTEGSTLSDDQILKTEQTKQTNLQFDISKSFDCTKTAS